jgi:AcrR family transcriptional regulator
VVVTEVQAGRAHSAARERILATADRLFYNEGIHAVGIHRIVDEAQVTRVTLYRHFPSKDDLIAAYLERKAQHDKAQVGGLMAAHPDDPRRVLTELASALTDNEFAAVQRGCPFINAAAEFAIPHPTRVQAGDIREWITLQVEDLLRQLDCPDASGLARQLMMLRTGAVMSAALDHDEHLGQNYLNAWNRLIDSSVPVRR